MGNNKRAKNKKDKNRGVSTDSRASSTKGGRSGSSSGPPSGASGDCGHLRKALNPTAVKKSLEKQLKADPSAFPACNACRLGAKNPKTAKTTKVDKSGKENAEGKEAKEEKEAPKAEAEESEVEGTGGSEAEVAPPPPPAVWVCLACGHQGCGRLSVAKHGLEHSEKQLTGSHKVAVSVPGFAVWCYECDDEVPPEQLVADKAFHALVSDVLRPLHKKHGPKGSAEETSTQEDKAPEKEKPKGKGKKEDKGKEQDLEDVRVKGLCNLGNTCFFNSVTQCLMQCQQLRRLVGAVPLSGGEKLWLAPPPLPRPSTPAKDGEAREGDADVTVLENLAGVEAELGSPGPVTIALSKLYADFHNASTSSMVAPKSLFGSVTAKAPRFRGYQQQDAHELLRFLVDLLKAEETGRVQTAICNQLSIPNPPLPHTPAWAASTEKLSPAQAQTLQAYHSVAPFPAVEAVFGGAWVQTIRCLVCAHVSQVEEAFLDASLPINTASLAKLSKAKAAASDEDLDGLLSDKKKPTGPSKAQQKKAKRETRRAGHGKKKGSGKKGASEPEESPVKDEGGSSHESSPDGVEVAAEVGTEAGEAEEGLGSDGEGDRASVDQEDALSEPAEDEDEDYGSGEDAEDEEDGPYREEQEKFRARAARLAPLPETLASGSLMGLFAAFTATETLCGKNKFGCENCARLGNFPPPDEEKKSGGGLLSSLKKKMTGEQAGEGSSTASTGESAKEEAKPKEEKKRLAYVEAEKNYLLFAPPAVFTIHLKRFQQLFRGFSKLSTPVSFPLLLDLAPFTSAGGEGVAAAAAGEKRRLLYALFGVVVHSGSMSGGHYIAYVKRRPLGQALQSAFVRRNPEATAEGSEEEKREPGPLVPPPGQWYEVSDSSFKPTTEDRVLKAQAYVLFYERIQ